MDEHKETPEERRERIRQEEWKDNAAGNFNDSLKRDSGGSLVDLFGAMGWKGTGILIIVIIIAGAAAFIFL